MTSNNLQHEASQAGAAPMLSVTTEPLKVQSSFFSIGLEMPLSALDMEMRRWASATAWNRPDSFAGTAWTAEMKVSVPHTLSHDLAGNTC